jgi:ATP-dependent Lon protease
MRKLDKKIKEFFPDVAVYKDDKVRAIFAGHSLPSFLKDWLINKFTDESTGEIDKEGILRFLERYMPGKGLKGELVKNPFKSFKVLARIITEPDVKKGIIRFYAPDLGIKPEEGQVSPHLLNTEEGKQLSMGEFWGICEFRYIKEEGKPGYIELSYFKPFKPYRVNLDYYLEGRKEFSTDEWIDLLIRSMEFNSDSPDLDFPRKLKLLTRLTVFVEPNLNIIELAPKGTGKSYVFSNLSKYGWLMSGGYVSRAKLFYDLNKKIEGLVSRYDFIALDEVQTIKFSDEDEIRGILKSYLENGTFNIGNFRGVAEAGFVILGNIPLTEERLPRHSFYFEELPEVFKESALLDRFHGLIKGWHLPRFNESLKVKGYALNVEFFSDILHQLRKRGEYATFVEDILEIPPRADTRDKKAIVKITTALLKLIFPDLERVNLEDFQKFCLEIAKEMRGVIKEQLHIIDPEYSPQIPDIRVKKNL